MRFSGTVPGFGFARDSPRKLKDMQKIETLPHSLAHVLAAAIQELYPGVKFGIGPAKIAKEISPIRGLTRYLNWLYLNQLIPLPSFGLPNDGSFYCHEKSFCVY